MLWTLFTVFLALSGDVTSRVNGTLFAPAHRERLETLHMTHVVLVDDDREFREMLSVVLEGRGYEVQSVCNGLKLIGALKVWRPDVLLVDVRMAWIDGIALTRSLKSNEMYRHLPVIVMSASLDLSIAERALSAGAHSFISKPFSFEVLAMRVREATGEMTGDDERVLVSAKRLDALRAQR